MSNEQRIAQLERQVATLIREGQRRQVVPWNPYTKIVTVKYLKVGGGNDILTNADGTWTGIKFQNSLTTFTVPTASPSIGTTYANGLGYGTLYDENNSSLGTVWIIDAYGINGTYFDMVQQTLFADGWYLTIASVQVPIAGSSPTEYATCYVPWRS